MKSFISITISLLAFTYLSIRDSGIGQLSYAKSLCEILPSVTAVKYLGNRINIKELIFSILVAKKFKR